MSMRRLLATLSMAAFIGMASPSQAQSASTGLPTVPTTRILAIGRVTAAWTPAARASVMPQEVRDTVRLYLDGKVEQWFIRKDQPGVVFVLNITSVEEAHRLLEALPLGRAKLMTFDLIPLGPLAPLGLLLEP